MTKKQYIYDKDGKYSGMVSDGIPTVTLGPDALGQLAAIPIILGAPAFAWWVWVRPEAGWGELLAVTIAAVVIVGGLFALVATHFHKRAAAKQAILDAVRNAEIAEYEQENQKRKDALFRLHAQEDLIKAATSALRGLDSTHPREAHMKKLRASKPLYDALQKTCIENLDENLQPLIANSLSQSYKDLAQTMGMWFLEWSDPNRAKLRKHFLELEARAFNLWEKYCMSSSSPSALTEADIIAFCSQFDLAFCDNDEKAVSQIPPEE